MAHKDMIGGTVYEVDHGKDRIGGTVYEIDHGKDLIGGTVYEVGFGVPCTVTILAYGVSPVGNANVTIDGQTYSAKGISVPPNQNNPMVIAELIVQSGTVMSCSALVPSGTTASWGVSLNGTTVASQSTYGTPAVYDYVVNGNVCVVLQEGAMPAYNLYTASVSIIEDTHVRVAINNNGYDTSYDATVSIDGKKYQNDAILYLPIGTQIYCYVSYSVKEGEPPAYIELNGTTVVTAVPQGMSGSGEYYYTATRHVQIELYNYDDFADCTFISITEQ
ncbi:MAG: hypothetical protein IKI93_16700 [Clostridia bacterium]|nr:hypothetical protein [Clostridia bacterium]